MNGDHNSPAHGSTESQLVSRMQQWSQKIVADRIAGASFPAIARKTGLSVSVCRIVCQRALKSGFVTAEQIRWTPRPKKLVPDEVYHRRWIARVRGNCVVDERGCWLWQGYCHPRRGYGHTNLRGRGAFVHRAMYMVVNKVQLGAGQLVCHKCDVPRCCNPDHLWLGTPAANSLDMVQKGRCHEWTRTHCPRGHEYTPENTIPKVAKSGRPARECKLCVRIRNRLRSGWSEEEAMTLPAVSQGFNRHGNGSRKRITT